MASWGDPVGSSRFGFNNDFLAFRPLSADAALLTVNFEYISPLPWRQGFSAVTGRPLPYDAVVAALASTGGKRDVWGDAPNAELKADITTVATEAMRDQGIGRAAAPARWQRPLAARRRP